MDAETLCPETQLTVLPLKSAEMCAFCFFQKSHAPTFCIIWHCIALIFSKNCNVLFI